MKAAVRLRAVSLRSRDAQEQLQRLFGSEHRRWASVCSREQQRALEQTENRGGELFRVAGSDAEAFESTADFVLPFLESIAGRCPQNLGLPRGFERRGRDRTA